MPIAFKLLAWFGFTVDHAYACRISSFSIFAVCWFILPLHWFYRLSTFIRLIIQASCSTMTFFSPKLVLEKRVKTANFGK